jgi:lipopolysaccharide transport system ATP-binding protein
MAFQQRCIDRMEEFKRSGVAIVFVSHNLQAVSSLCTQALFIAGTTRAMGRPDDVIREYVASAETETSAGQNDRVRIQSSKLFNDRDEASDGTVAPGSRLTLKSSFAPTVSARDVTFEFMVYRSTDNLLVYDAHLTNTEIGLGQIVPNRAFEIDFHFLVNLTRGHYRVVIRLYDNILQEFLSEVCPPATLVVEELQTWSGIAYLDVNAHARVSTAPGAAAMAEDRS